MDTIYILEKALGQASALFMKQEIKGTEIVMPTKELTDIAFETNRKLTKIMQKRIDKLKEALIWCSGSNDFQEDGKARKGWLRICKPLLDEKDK